MSDEAKKIVAEIREIVRDKPTAVNAYGLKTWEQLEGLIDAALASRAAADESAKPVDMSELVRKARLFDEAVEKKVIPPIFFNGATKRDPVLREALEQDGRKQHCKAHDFRPYYEGVEICSYCKTVRPEAAPVASKEAVTLSDADIQNIWIWRTDIHEGNLMPQLVDFAHAVLEAQRDASKAEGQS